MKTILCSILIFICSFFNAQTNLDSLWGVWNDQSQSDTNRLKAMQSISWNFIFSDPDSSFCLANLLYNFAESKDHKSAMCVASNIMGISFIVMPL